MKKTATTLRLLILSALATIVCATAFAFIGINYGEKLTASAAFKVDPETHYTVIQDDNLLNGYFNTYYRSGKLCLGGLSDKTFELLGVSPYKAGAISEDKPIKIVVPQEVQTIEAYAFDSCKGLKDIVFPEGLESFSSLVFEFSGLKELNLPASFTSLGDQRFVVNLEKITVAEGNTTYTTDEEGTCLLSADGKRLLLGTSRTVIPDTVTTIAANSFSQQGLKSLKIPANVQTISAPFVQSSIEELDLSENEYFENVKLEDGSYSGCIVKKTAPTVCISGIGEEVTVPTSIKTLQNDALSTGSIKKINLHSNVALYAMAIRAPYLEEITIYDGTVITNGSGVNTIEYKIDSYGNLYYERNGVKTLFTGVIKYENGKAIGKFDEDITAMNERCYAMRQIESIDIPESVTSMGDSVFWISGVKEIKMPSNIKSFGATLTLGAPYSFDAANYDGGNLFYVGSYLMDIAQPISGEYTVREGTTVINGSVFQNFGNLTKVTLPEGVISIGGFAFEGCTNLSTIYVPESLQMVTGDPFPSATRLIAPNEEAYESLKEGALSGFVTRLGYEIDVTYNIGGEESFTKKKLAGQPYGYQLDEATGEWKNVGFSPNGYDIAKWRNEATGEVMTIKNSTPVPTGITSLELTAMNDDDTVLTEVTALSKVALTNNLKLTYGEQYPIPLGYNPKYMSIKYESIDEYGARTTLTESPRTAGSYCVTITPEGIYWNDGTNDPVVALYTIKVLTIEELTWYVDGSEGDFDVMYNGLEHEVVAMFEDPYGAIGTHLLFPTGTYKNAGAYTVSVELPEELRKNFFLADSANKEITLVINPQEVEAAWNVDAGYQYLYEENKVQSPVEYITGNLTNLKDLLKYGVKIYSWDKDNSKWVEEPDGAIEVGKYKIAVELENDGTYGNFVFVDTTDGLEDKFTVSLEFEIIEMLVVKVVWENLQDWTYDGFDHTPVAYYTTNISAEKHYLTVTLTFGTETPDKAILAGDYTASVDVLNALSTELLAKLEQTHGKIYGWNEVTNEEELIYEYTGNDADGWVADGDGIDTVEFTIEQLEVILGWLNKHATFAYDGNAHNPIAYYRVNGLSILLTITITDEEGNEVVKAIDAGVYTVEITDERISNLDIGTAETTFTYEIEKQRSTVTVKWTGTTTLTYNGEEQAPVAVLFDLDDNEVKAVAKTTYATKNGALLKGAPVNIGSYKVTTKFVDEDGAVLSETSLDFDIVRQKVAKPVIGVSVFASLDDAKAYAPVNYDATYMVYSGAEGDGVYVMTVALKNDNYEWIDGTTDAESFTLKVSKDLSATVIGPEGVTYVTNNALSKTMLYAILGGIAVAAFIGLVALIAAFRRKNVIVNANSDNDGFYEDYE